MSERVEIVELKMVNHDGASVNAVPGAGAGCIGAGLGCIGAGLGCIGGGVICGLTC